LKQPSEQSPKQATDHAQDVARQSYHGKRMTASELEDAYAIAGILQREIKRSGSFYEARENYAFTYAKGKKQSPDQAQEALADVFATRYGQSMNQMREALLAKEQTVRAEIALPQAEDTLRLIKEGATMPYYKALDQAATDLAERQGITTNRAKSLMGEAYQTAHNTTLYEAGKALEEQHHKPVVEAERAAYKAERSAQSQAPKQQPRMRP